MEKVITYIDGFNLYFGMTKRWKDIKWLNVHALAKNLLKEGQELVSVKYFTSRVANNPGKQRRQGIYLEALMEEGVQIVYGQYQPNTEECRRCGHIWSSPKEKKTDVNIATQLLIDAYKDSYDTALLISGDSDLVPPVIAVKQHFSSKKIVVVFPPNRDNVSMKMAANASFILGRKKLKDSQLPLRIRKPDGYILEKPTEWR